VDSSTLSAFKFQPNISEESGVPIWCAVSFAIPLKVCFELLFFIIIRNNRLRQKIKQCNDNKAMGYFSLFNNAEFP
jgi:hypothetical protein